MKIMSRRPEYQPSPEDQAEIKKERTISEAELLKRGATYEGDRLVPTKEQVELIKIKHEKESQLPELENLQKRLEVKGKAGSYEWMKRKVEELDREFTSPEKIKLREKIVRDFKIYPDKIDLASDNDRAMVLLRVESGLYRVSSIFKGEDKDKNRKEDEFSLALPGLGYINYNERKGKLSQLEDNDLIRKKYYNADRFIKMNDMSISTDKNANMDGGTDIVLPLAGCPYADSGFKYRDAIKRILSDIIKDDASETINILVEGDDEIAKVVQEKFDQKKRGTDLENRDIKFHEFFDESVLNNFKEKFLEATGKRIFVGTGDPNSNYNKPIKWDVSFAYGKRRNGDWGENGKWSYRYDDLIKIEEDRTELKTDKSKVDKQINDIKEKIDKIPY